MSDNSGNDGTARIMLILFNRRNILIWTLNIFKEAEIIFFFLSKMNHYLYMKRECLLFWFSIERQIVWLQPFFRRIYYPKTDVFAEELSNTFRLYQFLTMYCQNQHFFTQCIRWQPLCHKKKDILRRKYSCTAMTSNCRRICDQWERNITLL